MRRQIREKPRSALKRFYWGSPIANIQIPKSGSPSAPLEFRHFADPAYLVSSKGFLLVRRAQRDCRYDRASARIWVRPDVDGTGAKAVQLNGVALLGSIEVGGAVEGGSQCDWCHGILCGSRWYRVVDGISS